MMSRRKSFNIVSFLRKVSCALLVAALGFGSVPLSAAARPQGPNGVIIPVTWPADENDAGPCGLITLANLPGLDGGISFREAICAANNTPGGPHIITFAAIPPGPPFLMFNIVMGPLPTITQPVTVDGWTYPGWVAGAPPPIMLNGPGVGLNGLTIQISPLFPPGITLIRGLIIVNFFGHGIHIIGPVGNVTVEGSYIGIDPPGLGPMPNLGNGILISNSSTNVIGGQLAGQGNVISWNTFNGVQIDGSNSTGNKIQGNMIGTNFMGKAPAPNSQSGIFINGAINTTIGGINPGEGNVISANVLKGIFIDTNLSNTNLVQGNKIGTDINGTIPPLGGAALGNGDAGVYISNASGNTIGGTTTLAGNVISNNHANGVVITGTTALQNLISANQIYSNTLLGIDLGNNGVTPNDNQDPDLGPNKLQNFPEIYRAANKGLNTYLFGKLNSLPSTTFTLQFYSVSTCDSSGYGEGAVYLGNTSVGTDASGNASFSVILATATISGHYATAIAIDPLDNTSEFSACWMIYGNEIFLPLVKK